MVLWIRSAFILLLIGSFSCAELVSTELPQPQSSTSDGTEEDPSDGTETTDPTSMDDESDTTDNDGDTSPSPCINTLTIRYEAPVPLNPDVAAEFPVCTNAVGNTHIHPSWHDYARIELTADGSNAWTITFEGAPTDVELRIRISDPNECSNHTWGASTHDVYANGVLLSRIVDTPGAGIEPGLGFEVDSCGHVTP